MINYELISLRAIDMKHFKVLAHQFRHTVALYDEAFRAVVGKASARCSYEVGGISSWTAAVANIPPRVEGLAALGK